MTDRFRDIDDTLHEALRRAADVAYDLVADERGVAADAAVSLVQTIAAIRQAQDEVAMARREASHGV